MRVQVLDAVVQHVSQAALKATMGLQVKHNSSQRASAEADLAAAAALLQAIIAPEYVPC